MNILLFWVPSNNGKLPMPLGLLSVSKIIEKCGFNAKIFDSIDFGCNEEDGVGFEKIYRVIEDYKPSIIGYGGITTSYGETKKLSFKIRKRYPEIIQIAGGPLSSVSKLLLTNAKIDAVFHGETEISLPIFLEKITCGKLYDKTPGISCLLNGQIMRNLPAEQTRNLDEASFLPYHLIDVSKYLHSIEDVLHSFKFGLKNNPFFSEILGKIGNTKALFPLTTSRGCTHKCSFCYRHVRGIRQNSVGYVINHLKYIQKQYNVNGFEFCDELFNTKQEWVLEFCDAIEKEKMNIIYRILGARADKINKLILQRLQKTGCFMINYGQESGSDAILKEYGKGISAKQNKETTLLTKEMGIHNTVQLVIGSPGETLDTIYESIQFLKDVDAYQYSANYLIPFPETPIWKYVEEKGLVKNLETYLNCVASGPGQPQINLTQVPDKQWKRWGHLIRKELRLYYYRKKKPSLYFFYYVYFNFVYNFTHTVPGKIKRLFKKVLPFVNLN
ncbi:MAG: B12-binding domain-containing radical SAM protein [Planctomycetes bacterium]|nr:B12-binding domain-containing radical SAM protein [Planctomycetota bacterium]